MSKPAGTKPLHTRHLAKPAGSLWVYVLCAFIGAFMGSLLDILIWVNDYPLTKVGAILLPVIAFFVNMSWRRRQRAGEIAAQDSEETYRKKIVAERQAKMDALRAQADAGEGASGGQANAEYQDPSRQTGSGRKADPHGRRSDPRMEE